MRLRVVCTSSDGVEESVVVPCGDGNIPVNDLVSPSYKDSFNLRCDILLRFRSSRDASNSELESKIRKRAPVSTTFDC